MNDQTYGYGHPFNYADKPVAKYVELFVELANDLPTGLSVTDLFAGVGTLANALRPVLAPKQWIGVELDWDCVMEFRKNCPWAECLWGNAFDVTDFSELVIIDPHKGTLNAIAKELTWINLFESIAESNKVKYILMQEYGAYWCHLPNQKPLYEKLCGEPVDKKNYRDKFTHYMEKQYGFKVIAHTMGLGSCYYLMETEP